MSTAAHSAVQTSAPERRSDYRMRITINTVWGRERRGHTPCLEAIVILQELGLTRDGALRVLCKQPATRSISPQPERLITCSLR